MKYNTDLPARPIFGYKILAEKTGISISALRTAAHDGRLNLTRYRGPGNMVIFDAVQVEACEGHVLIKDYKPEVTLAIELAYIHGPVMDALGTFHEIMTERYGIGDILTIARPEDAHELFNNLENLLPIISLAYVAAGVACSQVESKEVRYWVNKFKSKDADERKAAWSHWIKLSAPKWAEWAEDAALIAQASDLTFVDQQTTLLQEAEEQGY